MNVRPVRAVLLTLIALVAPRQLGAEDVPPATALADVTAVEATGSSGSYLFRVTVRSPDTGCDRYADWWEVVDADGDLLYRRILRHSHVNEQPFTRSGGPVPVAEDAAVVVRAHMKPGGYGGVVMRGSVATGFAGTLLPAGFAGGLAEQSPLPDACAF